MPTPFTHLEIAQRLLVDPDVPAPIRSVLAKQRAAFLLGNVAADARVNAGTQRADTHFYQYGAPIAEAPWRVMVAQNPALLHPTDADHRAFVAGYVAHLSVDEHWTTHMTHPHFALREWAESWERYYMLHILLIAMDERDYDRLESWQADALDSACPADWLPFMPDGVLCDWQRLIVDQIKPGGSSQTLNIFGGRIQRQPVEMRAILDSPAEIEARLWQHIPPAVVAEAERDMYTYARQQMIVYWDGTADT